MLSTITEQDFRILVAMKPHNTHGKFTKISEEETAMFGGTAGYLLVWQEGERFFSHKSMVWNRHGQKTFPEFNAGAVQEVFPTQIVSTVYLSASEISLQDFYHNLETGDSAGMKIA